MEYEYEFMSDDSLPQSDETSKIEEAAFDFEDLEKGEDISVDVSDNVENWRMPCLHLKFIMQKA